MLTEKQFHKILKTQAKFVNAPESFFDRYIEGKKMPKNWYLKYSWTEKQENKFRDWLVKYLMKTNKTTNKKWASNKASWYLLSYGWKIT